MGRARCYSPRGFDSLGKNCAENAKKGGSAISANIPPFTTFIAKWLTGLYIYIQNGPKIALIALPPLKNPEKPRKKYKAFLKTLK